MIEAKDEGLAVAALTCSPLTFMPTHILPGHNTIDPTPATFSASASDAPPLRKPNGCLLRSSPFMLATHMSGSGVEIKFIPRVFERPSLRRSFSFIVSKFIFLRLFLNQAKPVGSCLFNFGY